MARGPFYVLFMYSIALITLPIGTLFLVKQFLPLLWATVASVIVVHTILFAFVYNAFKEDINWRPGFEKAPEKME